MVQLCTDISDNEDLVVKYQLHECILWLCDDIYKTIALQFTDELLHLSVPITLWLKRNAADKTFFVLADSLHSSCCVDYTSARKIGADCLVHFGEACLSVTSQPLPVYHVFPDLALDTARLAERLFPCVEDWRLTEQCSPVTDITLFCQCHYIHAYDAIRQMLSAQLKSSVVCAQPLHSPFAFTSRCCVAANDDQQCCVLANRHVPLSLPVTLERPLLYVGSSTAENAELALVRLQLASAPPGGSLGAQWRRLLVYDPAQHTLTSETLGGGTGQRMWRQRMHATERLRGCDTVAVLVAAPHLHGCVPALAWLQRKARAAGKSCHSIVCTRPDACKLANWADVQAYVMLACPLQLAREILLPACEGRAHASRMQPLCTCWDLVAACDAHIAVRHMYACELGCVLPPDGRYCAGGEDTRRPREETEAEGDRHDMQVALAHSKCVSGRWAGLEVHDVDGAAGTQCHIVQGVAGTAWAYHESAASQSQRSV